LIELLLTILENKWKIFFITLLTIIITFSLLDKKKPTKQIYLSESKIEPISTFDEFEYELYNSYLNSIDKKSILHTTKEEGNSYDNFGKQKLIRRENIEIYKIIDHTTFKNINKYYLLNLFIDKLNENSLFIYAVKKFNLIKREDYPNDELYEKAVTKLASSIKLTQNEDTNENDKKKRTWIISFKTEDIGSWENFLSYIEKSTNEEIQKYLYNSFTKLIQNEKRLKDYKIEDIDWEIENNGVDLPYINDLERMKKKIITNKSIDRLEKLFAKTPIENENNFIAAKIRIQSTNYTNITKNRYERSNTAKLLISALLGLIFSVFFVLISKAIKNRI